MVLYTDINFFLMAVALAPVGLIPALIGLGGLAVSAISGRQSPDAAAATRANTSLATSQAKLARGRAARETAFFDQTKPIIGQLIPQLQALLTGDRDKLTQRFAPSLQALTQQRQGAQERIQQQGPASGATAQASIELEKASFAERNRLLSSAPAEAQQGLQQLLNLLLGAGQSQGAASSQAASVAGGANQSVIQADALNRATSAGLFQQILEGAKTFGGSLFKPKGAPGGSIAQATGSPNPGAVFNAPTPNFLDNPTFKNLNGGQ